MSNGILVIDKPENFTSHDVVAKARRILKTKSIGHTGTLDPFATGVLVILVGRATRLAQFLDKAEKEYLATIQFGWETDTGDRTGSRIADCGLRIAEIAARIADDNLEAVLAKFRGETWQTPPMYSAKKIGGKKLYELARKGEEIERQPVKINIPKLELTTNNEQLTTNQTQIRVAVSAGTYIRVLAEDIGRELKIGAHLAELRRTRAGNFDLSQAVTLAELENLANENRLEKVLISPNVALAHLPSVKLSKTEVERTLNGMKTQIANRDFAEGQFVRLSDEKENLIAVGEFQKEFEQIQPRVVIAEKEEN